MLRGPSARARQCFVVLPQGKCCPASGLQLSPGPGADVSSPGVSRASLCPIAQHPRPVPLLPAPSAPTSRAAAPQLACTAGCSLTTVAPKPPLPHRVTTWCCSLHQPRVAPCPSTAPTSAAREVQIPSPGEGQCQAPTHAAGCPVGKSQGEVPMLLPSSQPWCPHCFCSAGKGPGVGRCSADGCRAAECTAMVWFGEKEPEGPPHHSPQLPEEGIWRGRC